MRITTCAVFLGLLTLAHSTRDLFIEKKTTVKQKCINTDRRMCRGARKLIIPAPPTVSAPAGNFKGHWDIFDDDVRIASFEGIPYAQPPVGSLRFQVAQPLTLPLTDFTASKPGKKCSQRTGYGPSSQVIGEEDCLYINVYVPEIKPPSKKALLPVMVFVHGGGFVEGDGYRYKTLNFRNRDVVLVTFNYRLGPLGFLTTEDDVIPSNLGLKDQVAALRWVHDNIASFGGNPNLVTVVGHGAGGASAEFLMLSPLTKGLIHRAIAMSGSAQANWALDYIGENWELLGLAGGKLGCSLPSLEFLSCLQNKTHQEITGMDFHIPGWIDLLPPSNFKPVVEGNVSGAFLPHHPRQMYSDRLYNDIPFMTGVVENEAHSFTSRIFRNETLLDDYNTYFLQIMYLTLPGKGLLLSDAGLAENLRKDVFMQQDITKSEELWASVIYRDLWYIWPMMTSVSYRKKTASTPAYLYYFSYSGTASSEDYTISHGDDLFYMMLPKVLSIEQKLCEDYEMSRLMTDLLTSFAKDGVPKTDFFQLEWQPVTSSEEYPFLGILKPRDDWTVNMEGFLTTQWRFIEDLSVYRAWNRSMRV